MGTTNSCDENSRSDSEASKGSPLTRVNGGVASSCATDDRSVNFLLQLPISWPVFDREFPRILEVFSSKLLLNHDQSRTATDGGAEARELSLTTNSNQTPTREDSHRAFRAAQRSKAISMCSSSAISSSCEVLSVMSPTDPQHQQLPLVNPNWGGSSMPMGMAKTVLSGHPLASSTLRIAVLSLGVDGLRRMMDVLAFIASGGQSQEERTSRAVRSGSAFSPTHVKSSSWRTRSPTQEVGSLKFPPIRPGAGPAMEPSPASPVLIGTSDVGINRTAKVPSTTLVSAVSKACDWFGQGHNDSLLAVIRNRDRSDGSKHDLTNPLTGSTHGASNCQPGRSTSHSGRSVELHGSPAGQSSNHTTSPTRASPRDLVSINKRLIQAPEGSCAHHHSTLFSILNQETTVPGVTARGKVLLPAAVSSLCALWAHQHLSEGDIFDLLAAWIDSILEVQECVEAPDHSFCSIPTTPHPVIYQRPSRAALTEALEGGIYPCFRQVSRALASVSGCRSTMERGIATPSGNPLDSPSGNGVQRVARRASNTSTNTHSELQNNANTSPPSPLGNADAATTPARSRWHDQPLMHLMKELCPLTVGPPATDMVVGVLRGGGGGKSHESASAPCAIFSSMLSALCHQRSAFVLHRAYKYVDSCGVYRSSGPSASHPHFVEESGSAPQHEDSASTEIWPLSTRLVNLRQQYVSIYNSQVSSVALLGGHTTSFEAEDHMPIALIDLAGAAGSDLRILSGQKEVMYLSITAHQEYGSVPTDEALAMTHGVGIDTDVSGRSLPSSISRQNSPVSKATSGHTPSLSHSDQEGLQLFVGKLRVGEIGVLAVSRHAPHDGLTLKLMQTMVQGSASSSSEGHSRSSYKGLIRMLPKGSLDAIQLVVYPVRLLYRRVEHCFYFQSASQRNRWYEHVETAMLPIQSREQMLRILSATQNVDRFIRRCISYPVGPSAFDYVEMLGAGNFGRVLLVKHKLTGKPFAMKIIRKSGFRSMRNIIEVRREKSILEAMDCPYIMKFHATFQTDSRVYLLLDFLSGGELLMHTQHAQDRHLDESTARFFLAEIAIAVEHLRVHGVVHRDIKGDNLVLDSEGHVVLTDFGFAKKIVAEEEDGAITSTPHSTIPGVVNDFPRNVRIIRQHTSCGTLAYIAPEILKCGSRKDEGYAFAVDWWSTGVVFFTILTGFFPFLKSTTQKTTEAICNRALQFPAVKLSDAAKDLLMQLLNKVPAQRIASLAQLKSHSFFKGFDWEACEQRRLHPPKVLHRDLYITPTESSENAKGTNTTRNTQPTTSGSNNAEGTSASKTTARFAQEFIEELDEIQLILDAYGASDGVPNPAIVENDAFGPLFERQEHYGSDRGGEEDPLMDGVEYIPHPPLLLTRTGHGVASDSIGATANYFTNSSFYQEHSVSRLSTSGISCGPQSADDTSGANLIDPILEDYDEKAYTSMMDIRQTAARTASDAGLSLYRPASKSFQNYC